MRLTEPLNDESFLLLICNFFSPKGHSIITCSFINFPQIITFLCRLSNNNHIHILCMIHTYTKLQLTQFIFGLIT